MTETLQHPWELQQLTNLAAMHSGGTFLEIGTHEGGTLNVWLRHAQTVVVIDDQMRHPEEWQDWADWHNTTLELIHGNSADPAIIERAAAHGDYDLVFVDADHHYQAVRQDWDNYQPMVKPGGMVVFHDIRPSPDCDVHRLWAEIKAEPGRKTAEFHHRVADWGGIGVVWTQP